MAKFPDDPAPNTPYPWTVSKPTARGGARWSQRIRSLTHEEIASTVLSYRGLTWAMVQTLYAFWASVRDSADRTFTFVDFNGYDKKEPAVPKTSWTDLYVGMGDGATTEWDLPTYALLETGATVKIDGTTKSISWGSDHSGTHGWILPGAGTDGLDKLHLTAAAADGKFITITGTCRRAMRIALFGGDDFPFETISDRGALQAGSIEIVEQIA